MENKAIGGQGIRIQTRRDGTRETGAARSVNVCERDAGTELGTHHDVGIATGRQK